MVSRISKKQLKGIKGKVGAEKRAVYIRGHYQAVHTRGHPHMWSLLHDRQFM